MESTNNCNTHNDVNEADGANHSLSSGRGRGNQEATQVVTKRNPPNYNKKNAIVKIATWNVRSFNVEGRLENAVMEMKRNNIAVMGICETHWEGDPLCDFVYDGHRVVGSGGELKRHGVALIFEQKLCGEILQCERISERLMMIKLKAEPVDMMIIQVYMPTSKAKEEEIDDVYEMVEDILKENRGKYNTIIMGDFNAVVGEGKPNKAMGSYGLGKKNKRGQKLIDFAKRNKFVITNTLFNHHKRRRYTWKMPGDIGRYQIDYVLVKERYKNGVKNCRAYPGMDVYSDHNALVMSMNVKFKKIKKARITKKWNLEALNSTEKRDDYIKEVEEKINCEAETSENLWGHIKSTIVTSAETHLGYVKKSSPKKPWITQEMINKMDERRKWKTDNSEEGQRMYKKLNNLLRRETDKAKQKWLKEQCEEIEELDKRGRSDLMYAKAKEMGKKYKKNRSTNNNIQDSGGKILKDQNKIKERWKEYFETLYDAENKPTT